MSESNGFSIHPATTVGPVKLAVADLVRSRRFYEDVLGFKTIGHDDNSATLGTADGLILVELTLQQNSETPGRRATGLFHHAILLPSRAALGRSLSYLAESGWSLSGAGDHLVSEALYLNDPDGNGIELYADRPRSTWTYQNGLVHMDTLSVDIESLIREGKADGSPWIGLPVGTTMGHVHLKVSDLEAAGRFYHDVIGFDIVSKMPQALFLSAGGYHHHLGLNTWMSAGSPPPASNAVGLRSFSVNLPNELEFQKVFARVTSAKIPYEEVTQGILVRDPSQNGVVLRSAE